MRPSKNGSRGGLGAGLLYLLALATSCGSEVTVVDGANPDGAGSTGAVGGECKVCNRLSVGSFGSGLPSDRRPWCPGEEAKYDALFACACSPESPNNCLDIQGCYEGDIEFASLYCDDGGDFGGDCEACLYERCRDEAIACGNIGKAPFERDNPDGG